MSDLLISGGVVFALLVAVGGWWCVTVWNEGRRRDRDIVLLRDALAALRLHVAEEYVQKDDLHQMFQSLRESISAQFAAVGAQFNKMDARFDKLESHIDRKADKG